MSDYATEELREATDALSDANILRGGGSDEAIVNRLYYACFHAAQAVLFAKGFEASSHRGVIAIFGREVVQPGEASKDDGRFLNEMRDLREQADYGYDPIHVNADRLFARTEAFVDRMEALVDDATR